MVASGGCIFSLGNAQFFGSMGGKTLTSPSSDRGRPGHRRLLEGRLRRGCLQLQRAVLREHGSIHLNKPIVGMEASPNGQGYRFVASDGGIFS